MDSKKIPTCLGTAILVVITITIGVFVWTYEKNQISDETDTITQTISKPIVKTDTQKNDEVNIADISKWKNFDNNTYPTNPNFKFNFKYPDAWFAGSDIAGESFFIVPFYSKNTYSKACKDEQNGKITCIETGHIAMLSIEKDEFLKKEVSYNNKQTKPIKIDGHEGFITEGEVADTQGNISKNGQCEIGVVFPNMKGGLFQIFMKIEKDSDRDIFDQIVKTLNFK